MEVLHYPDPRLRKRGEPLDGVDDDVRSRVEEMIRLMHEEDGMGLAATQVGWPARLIVVNPTCQQGDDRVLVNPEILEEEGESFEEEGCLSLPGVKARVKRAARVRARATDLDGNVVEIDAEDLYARALQHEIDHLDGQLFIDRLSPSARMTAAKELARLRREFSDRTK